MSNSLHDDALNLHKEHNGKISIHLKTPIETKEDLSLVYTPGVAEVSRHLAAHPEETNEYTWRGRCVAVISDGSAVLGLGNIGPEGAYPVMEGKCALFKRFAGLDAVPILLNTQDPDEIIRTVQHIAPSFGAINLEDISAPRCFYIEEQLKKTLNIPIIHDDQWGTAVVVYSGLLNACKVVGKNISDLKIVVNGVGAAGSAIVKILHHNGVHNILACDSTGIIFGGREGNSEHKESIASISNPEKISGSLQDAAKGAYILIGVSKANLFTKEMIQFMSKDAIVFALANPSPEIMPDDAKATGVAIIATGRSDFPNQVNNALGFPGIFKGVLDAGITTVNLDMLTKAAVALSDVIQNPDTEHIIPSVFDEHVVLAIAESISRKV